MSMFTTPVELKEEIKSLKGNIKGFQERIRELEFDKKCMERKRNLDIEEAKNTLRKDMEKALIESDLKRVEAVAKLEAYEKMDTKAERQHIQKMLEAAIAGLSSAQKVIVK